VFVSLVAGEAFWLAMGSTEKPEADGTQDRGRTPSLNGIQQTLVHLLRGVGDKGGKTPWGMKMMYGELVMALERTKLIWAMNLGINEAWMQWHLSLESIRE